MSQPPSSRRRPGPKPRPPLRREDVEGLKYFKLIATLLESLHDHADCPNRRLHYDQLGALVILYFFNPVLTSLRSIQQASGLRNVQRKLGVRRTSLGSLSESSRVFDPDLLKEIVEELSDRAAAGDAPRRPAGLSEELDVIAVDGSLLEGLPRMAWALWLDDEHRAAKVHREFDLLRGAPGSATVTDGNGNEKQVLADRLEADRLYVLDAGYGKYELFEAIRQSGSSFGARLYRYRWSIELFFRWFKCVLRFDHLMFESKEGVRILVYCARIASLLITLWTGRKPTKRTLEMVQLYFQGWAELDELEAHIGGLERNDG